MEMNVIERKLHLCASYALIFFSGWTLSTHFCVIFGLSLKSLVAFSPFIIAAIFMVYQCIENTSGAKLQSDGSYFWQGRFSNKYMRGFLLLIPFIVPFLLYFSWIAFWFFSIISLIIALVLPISSSHDERRGLPNNIKFHAYLVIILLSIAVVVLSYIVTRSDLDDAFYVAVAAFSSSHPDYALLSTDPMLGASGFPLIFPSYLFSSFELFSGAISYLLTVPSMDIYYIYLLPLWVLLSIIVIFLLTKEMLPQQWILAGVMTIILILLLGEMHRGHANFSFFRIYQGKAVLVSFVIPFIFYLTARFFSKNGTWGDLFLLGCCQITAIGFSNFGMLAAPIAGFSAIISNVPLIQKNNFKKPIFSFFVLFLSLPYLIYVAIVSKGSIILTIETETAKSVWYSVFGVHQQYFVGFLLLAGPLFSKSLITRWRLAAPYFMLLAFYLNPWLSQLISKYMTTPPVYWRVVWSFPVLIFTSVSFCIVLNRIVEHETSRLLKVSLVIMLSCLTFYALPYNTLRVENIGKFEGFAKWKVPRTDITVAQAAIEITPSSGVLLAPDDIASAVSRFEKHPTLVSTRGAYVQLFKNLIPHYDYISMNTLYGLITGSPDVDQKRIEEALRYSHVSVVVIHLDNESPYVISILESNEYKRLKVLNGYVFWKKL